MHASYCTCAVVSGVDLPDIMSDVYDVNVVQLPELTMEEKQEKTAALVEAAAYGAAVGAASAFLPLEVLPPPPPPRPSPHPSPSSIRGVCCCMHQKLMAAKRPQICSWCVIGDWSFTRVLAPRWQPRLMKCQCRIATRGRRICLRKI